MSTVHKTYRTIIVEYNIYNVKNASI